MRHARVRGFAEADRGLSFRVVAEISDADHSKYYAYDACLIVAPSLDSCRCPRTCGGDNYELPLLGIFPCICYNCLGWRRPNKSMDTMTKDGMRLQFDNLRYVMHFLANEMKPTNTADRAPYGTAGKTIRKFFIKGLFAR